MDAFSKYAWVEPIKSKTGIAATEAFKKILRRAEGRTPQTLQTDDGKEIYNHTFQKLMKDKDIHYFSTTGDTKASMVERFNRTLKSRMYRYFTSANTYKYLNVFQVSVRGYNESFHRSIGMKPSEVTLENVSDVWDTLYGKKIKTTMQIETPISSQRESSIKRKIHDV